MNESRPSILVVDDDTSVLAAISRVVEDLQVNVVTACSGEEALQLLKGDEPQYALVLLDVQMPGLDGFETALRIRQHEPPLHLPVIFLSGNPTGENVLRGYREGAVDFLAKPFLPEILRSKVRVFLELYLVRERLAQRERFISAVTQSTPEVIYVYDVVEQRNIFINREVALTLGYTPEQIGRMGSSLMQTLIHPEDYPGYLHHLEAILTAADGDIQHHEFRMRHADGTWRWIASRRTPFSRENTGKLRLVVGAAHDVTEQHAAREETRRLNQELAQRVEERTRALSEAEDRLRLLMENVTEHAIFTLDRNGHILEWNLGAERLFDYSADEIVGANASLLFTPEDREAGVPELELRHAAEAGKASDERWHLRRGGQRFYVSGVTTALRDEAGNLRGFAKICRDMTRDKLAQDALRESEQRLQIVADSLPALIGYVDRGLRYRFNNIMYEKWFGIPRRRLVGMHMSELMGPQAMEVLRPHIQEVLAGKNVQFRELVPYPNGQREIEGNYVPSYNRQGEVEGFAVLKTDITERAREERRRLFLLEASTVLASSLEYEAALVRITQLAVPSLADWCAVDVLDEDGSIRRLAVAHPDPEKERVAVQLQDRFPTASEADSGVARVIRTGEPQLVPEVTEEMLREAAISEEHLALLRQLSLRSYLSVPLLARGRAIGALTFASVNEERIRFGPEDLHFAEELARRAAAAIDTALLFRAVREENAQRREAEARLANAHEEVLRASHAKSAFLSSMSHELRTPLNAIIGYAELLQDEIPEHDEKTLRQDLGKIQSSARHLLALINDVLDISKIEAGKVALNWEEIEIQKVVEEAVSMVTPLADRNGNQIILACAGRMGTIYTDPTRLRQILFNLLSNAAKFTHNGTISVDCSRSLAGADGRDWVELRIQDTGPGIPQGEVASLFEKFQQFEAGRKHGGTGLGLAITRLLARAMGGEVHAESELGGGSVFTVRLPMKGEASGPGPL